MPDSKTPDVADMLRLTASMIDALTLDDSVQLVEYTPLTGPAYGPGVTLVLRPAAWSPLAIGQTITWDAYGDHAEGWFRAAKWPWLRVRARWSRDELEAAAPKVAATVLIPTARRSATTWPAGGGE